MYGGKPQYWWSDWLRSAGIFLSEEFHICGIWSLLMEQCWTFCQGWILNTLGDLQECTHEYRIHWRREIPFFVSVMWHESCNRWYLENETPKLQSPAFFVKVRLMSELWNLWVFFRLNIKRNLVAQGHVHYADTDYPLEGTTSCFFRRCGQRQKEFRKLLFCCFVLWIFRISREFSQQQQ